MTNEQILDTARSFVGKGIRYEMGADDLSAPDLALDCSAFVWRVLGQRKFDGKRWRNTDWIAADATGPQTTFRKVDKPTPGCIAVYSRNQNGGKVGHVAIIADPSTCTVVDCSSSQNGVTEHVARYFWQRASTGRATFAQYVGG